MDKKRTFLLITLMSLFLLLIVPIVSSLSAISPIISAVNLHLFLNNYLDYYGLGMSEAIVTYSVQGTILILGLGVIIPAIMVIAGFLFTLLSAKKNKLIIPAYIFTGLALLSLAVINGTIMFLTFGYDVTIIVFNSLYIGIPVGTSYRSSYGHFGEGAYRYTVYGDFDLNMTYCIIYIVFYSFFMIISALLFFAPIIPFVFFVISFILAFIKKKEKQPVIEEVEEKPALEEQPQEVEVAL